MSRKHILLTNDDGVDAYGLGLLAEMLAETGDFRLSTVAPASQQSASSHSLTLHSPLRVLERGERRWAVTGTPTDSVLVAVEHILKDDPPDMVVSGVNHGANMGEDVTYSGTVAAALEGSILGLPSYAVSCTSHQPADWGAVKAFLRYRLKAFLDQPLPRHSLLNINIPPVPESEIKGIRVVPLGSRIYQDVISVHSDPRGDAYLWIGGNGPVWDKVPDTDATLNRDGYVVVTPLKVDMTNTALLKQMRNLDLEGPLAPPGGAGR